MQNSKNFSELGRRAVSSTIILVVRRILLQILISVFSIIIARVLIPTEYGFLSILLFILTVFSIITDIGLGPALVQQQSNPTNKQIKSIFTVTLSLSLICSYLLWLFSPTIISIFGNINTQSHINDLRLLTLAFPIIIPGNISHALLERNLQYGPIAIGEVTSNVIGKTLAILLTLHGLGITGLVIGEIVTRIVGTILYYKSFPWSIGISFNIHSIMNMLTFGIHYQISSSVDLIGGAIVPFYIGINPGPGGWSGLQAVGFLTFAGGVAGIIRLFSENIGHLVFPVVSRTQENITRARLAIEKSLEMSSFTIFALFSVVFPLTHEITSIIYTSKWLPATPVLFLFLIQSSMIGIELSLMNALLAIGASTTYQNIKILFIMLQFVLTVIFVRILGFYGFGLSSLLVSTISVLLVRYILSKKIAFNFISKTLPFAILSIPVILINLNIKTWFQIDSIWNLIFIGILNLSLYIFLVYVFLKKSFKESQIYIWNLLIKNKNE